MNEYDKLFNDPKYKVKKTKIKLNTGDCVYKFSCKAMDISDMLFIERDDGTYEPWMYEYKKNENGTHTGKRIVKGTIAYDFIQSIHYTEKITNQRTKQVIDGNLSILQWYIGVTIVNSSIKYQKKRWDLEVVRQFGKTFLSARIAGFLPIYAPLYADMPNDRWWQIIASYNDDSVKEIFDLKVKPMIIKNIELFNKQNPNDPLIYGRYRSETFVKDKNKIEVRREINGKTVPYSYVVAISTNTTKDGKSCDFMWCDEAWNTNAKEFRRGVLPFLSTGGDLLVSGITTANTESLMYNVHFEFKNSIPLVCDCFAAYNYLKHDYPRRGENIRYLAEEEFEISGFDSTESQSNYRMTWDLLEDGKFYTLDMLRRNNNFSYNNSLGIFNDINREYRVCGLDLANINDYCVLTVWDVYKINKTIINENGERIYRPTWKNKLREVIIYNLDRKPMSAEDVAKKVAKDCNTYEVDMLLVDGTSNQRVHNEWIYKKIRELNINTFVAGYDFSGDKNKVLLMSHFEEMLKSGLIEFGSEEEIKTHKSYKILYNEIIKLFKGYEKGKRNIQWKAKGKGNTDDCVMSSALGCYCVPYIEMLEKNNKFIEINSYRYRAKLNKFSENKNKEKKEIVKNLWQIPS